MTCRKLVGVWLVGFCVLMSTPEFGETADSQKEKVSPTGSTERHLANIRQLTFGRQNAEAYFSFDGTK
ncbi:MAG: hypothetical protein OEU68_09235, partial [Nitrospira sp.]|nr:hypothetical protein [Nitrospira sp.]